MTSKRKQNKPTRKVRTGVRKVKVWADHRTPPDMDRFVAVLVALALRRIEEEAEAKTEADHG